jgi:hypothetical protein
LLAGVRLNTAVRNRGREPILVIKHGVTAQCYYISPQGLKAVWKFIDRRHEKDVGFDNLFCNAIRSGGMGVYLMNPPICQHIGIESEVRPGWGWTKRNIKGRIGYSAKGPFVLLKNLDDVKIGI